MHQTFGNLTVFGEHDEQTVEQMWVCMGVGSVERGTLCADGHLGYAVPIGGVLAYREHVSPSAVGFDIGCGVSAIKLDQRWQAKFADRRDFIAGTLQNTLAFGLGRRNDDPVALPDSWWNDPRWQQADVENLREGAAAQLGTIGSGNHFVNLCEDAEGWTWIVTHFGSRGLGHKIATKYLKLAGGVDGMKVPPAVLELDSAHGRAYWAGMTLATTYASMGRWWVLDKVRKMIGGEVTDTVSEHHNAAWMEQHDGKELCVVRKGATPAFPGMRGVIGSSMGDEMAIVEGVDSELSRQALYSTVHGAGRVMGRNVAKKTLSRDEWQEWLEKFDVTVRGGDLDESPMAYRRANVVLGHHLGTIKVTNWLRPKVSIMASNDVRDPYKD